jgi:hypothetical protein
MDFMSFRTHVVRRWWVVAALVALAFLGAALALVAQGDDHERTVHFVLRPDASVSNDDLPGALDALESDGPLVQSVIGVLGGDEMLRRAALDAGVPYGGDFDVETAGRPGSALIDSTVTASSDQVIDQLAAAYARTASDYVGSSYSAYVLARLSIESGGNGTGPSAAQSLIIAALAGALLGLALLAAELRLRGGVPAPAAEMPQVTRPYAPTARDGRPTTTPRPRVVEPLHVRPPEPREVRSPASPDVHAPEPVAVAEPIAVPGPATRKAPASRPKSAPRAKPASRPKAAAEPKATPEPTATPEPRAAAGPKTTAEPEDTAEPQAAAEPKTAPEPKANAKPKTTAQPKRTARPRRAARATAASEPRAGSKAAAKPDSEPVSDSNGTPDSKPASGSKRKPATPAKAGPNEHEG